MKNPPAGYKPAGQPVKTKAGAPAKAASGTVDYEWSEMLRTPQFMLLWIMYVFAAGAGLMVIGKLAKIVDLQAGIKAGFIFVAMLAIGNAAGRVTAGVLSDKIGRTRTMFAVFVFQAVLMFVLRGLDTYGTLFVASVLIGFNYGANLSVFPSATKDYFGLKNFGVNYGFVFTAWGGRRDPGTGSQRTDLRCLQELQPGLPDRGGLPSYRGLPDFRDEGPQGESGREGFGQG